MKTAVTDFAFCFVCIASVSTHVGFQIFVYPANEVDYRPEPNMLKLLPIVLISFSFLHLPKVYPLFLFYHQLATYHSHIVVLTSRETWT